MAAGAITPNVNKLQVDNGNVYLIELLNRFLAVQQDSFPNDNDTQ